MFRVAVVKKSMTAFSSNEGEFETSTTTDAPSRTVASPSPVSVLTPVSGDAGTASWPCSRSLATSFDPMRPVPPMMTSFMIEVPFSMVGPFLQAIDRIRRGVVTSCRGRGGRDGSDVGSKETLEIGDIAAFGCGDEEVEKTSVLGRARGHPAATGDVLPGASHDLPRVCLSKPEDRRYIAVRIV